MNLYTPVHKFLYKDLQRYFSKLLVLMKPGISKFRRFFNMRVFKDCLFMIFRPDYWIQLRKYDKAHDDWIIEQLKSPTFSDAAYLTIKLDGKRLWLGNYPYSYGHEYYSGLSLNKELRPSGRNIYKLKKAVDEYDKDGRTKRTS